MRVFSLLKTVAVAFLLSPAMLFAQTKPATAPTPAAAPMPKPAPAPASATAPASVAASASRWRIDANGLTFVADLGDFAKSVNAGIGTVAFGPATEKADNIVFDEKSGAVSFRISTAGFAIWFQGRFATGSMAGNFSYHAGAPTAPKPSNAADYKFKWSAQEVDANGRAVWRATVVAPSTVAAKGGAAVAAVKREPIRTGPPCTPGASRSGLWHMRAGFEFFDLDMTGANAVARVGSVVQDVDSIAYDEKTAKISFRRKAKEFSQWFDGCVARNVIHGRFAQQKADAPKPSDDTAFAQMFYGKRSWRQPVAAVVPAGGAAPRPLVPAFAQMKSPCTPRASRHSIWRVNANGYPLAFDLTAPSNAGFARSLGESDPLDSITYDEATAKISFRRVGKGFTQWFDGCIAKDRIVGQFAHLASAGAAKPTKASDYIFSFRGHRASASIVPPRTRWSRDRRVSPITPSTPGSRR